MSAQPTVSGRKTRPRFRQLSTREIEEVLRRNNIGRIAYARPDRQIEIRQINYVFDGDWIFGRTSWSEKIEHLTRYWWAAFAVDEVDGIFDWRSVTINGGLYRLEPEGNEHEVERYWRAVNALRRIIPETLTPDDPVPFRNLILGLAVQEVHGRAATSRVDAPGFESV
jgi:nitroimidazol reductase NimA-like FMN-containing flavoprotein (pyridoxamine 5'-phosphate oxidase superfamily)